MSLKADYSWHPFLATTLQFRIRQEHTGIIRIYLHSTAMVLGEPPNPLVSVNSLPLLISLGDPWSFMVYLLTSDGMAPSC